MTKYDQCLLFQNTPRELMAAAPVNVSSVPQRSPFRYPGGKTWFVPTFRNWIKCKDIKPQTLVEPFAGGGIISLTAVFENLVDKAVMIEMDDEVSAVWKTMLGNDVDWLIKRILEFNMTRENLIAELEKAPKNTAQKAFQTILKNRTYHGGILARGSGLIKVGENGKGVQSRWYPQTLARRISEIKLIKDMIEFIEGDCFYWMPKLLESSRTIAFVDPPYTAGGKKAGKRLYKHCELDHDKLFSVLGDSPSDFLMTYDDADEVKDLAVENGFATRLVPMNNTHHAMMMELVVGRDLSWLGEQEDKDALCFAPQEQRLRPPASPHAPSPKPNPWAKNPRSSLATPFSKRL